MILASKSVPPVDPFAFNIIAVPIPTITEPYKKAKNLSSVAGCIFAKRFKNIHNNAVPNTVLIKNFFPTLKYAIANNGIFNSSIVVPRGIFSI